MFGNIARYTREVNPEIDIKNDSSFSKCYRIVSGLIDLEPEKEGAGGKEPSGRDNGRTGETTLGDGRAWIS